MVKISRKQLRNIILKEIQSMEEDAIVKRSLPGVLPRHDDPGRQIMYKSCSECGYKMSVYEGDEGVCEQCGSSSMMKEGKSGMCEQCGTSSMVYEGDEGVCEQCGYSTMEAETKKEYLNEGSCGGCPPSCEGCNPCEDDYESGDYEVLDYDMDDDFIPDHMHHDYDNDVLTPGEAFGVGISIGQHDKNDIKIGNHKHYKGSYMAKSHLYKVNKYAEKLYHMIPDGHNLEDWMRTKLAQIADDIGEVYHALDHHKFKGDV